MVGTFECFKLTFVQNFIDVGNDFFQCCTIKKIFILVHNELTRVSLYIVFDFSPINGPQPGINSHLSHVGNSTDDAGKLSTWRCSYLLSIMV